mgnify:CR=1 FL=1
MRAPFAFLPLLAAALLAQQPDAARRLTLETTLQLLVPSRTPQTGRISPHDKTWEEWLRRTGELPPDFDSMPSVAALPDPLVIEEVGKRTPVTNMAQWRRRKQWIRSQVERWVFGTFPPAPGNLRAVVQAERREGTTTVREVLLEFGPQHRATLHVTLVIPGGKGPFPVFLTNRGLNHSWVYTAVNRGYIVCAYNATDPKYGAADDSDAYMEIWPEYDFSCLARWAWAASRAEIGRASWWATV